MSFPGSPRAWFDQNDLLRALRLAPGQRVQMTIVRKQDAYTSGDGYENPKREERARVWVVRTANGIEIGEPEYEGPKCRPQDATSPADVVRAICEREGHPRPLNVIGAVTCRCGQLQR